MLKNILTAIVTSIAVGVLFLAGTSAKAPSAGGNFSVADKFEDGTIYARGGIKLGTSQTTFTNSSGQVTIGSSGSALTKAIKGTCNLTGGTIAATSSAVANCAVTGVVDGDLVFATLATSTNNGVIIGARASTTAGFITVRLLNLSGAASSVSALGSSTAYWIVR